MVFTSFVCCFAILTHYFCFALTLVFSPPLSLNLSLNLSLLVSSGFAQLAWKDIELQPQESCALDSVTWVLNNLNIGGLSNSSVAQTHYLRDESKKLNGVTTKNSLWIDGCPGVGKSTTLFAWGRSLKKKVLWVHFENGKYTLVNFENGEGKQCELYNTEIKWNDIVNFAVSNKFDVVLLDGIRDDMKNIFANIKHESKCILVACTSYQSGGYNTEAESKLSITYYHVSSWSFFDYTESCRLGVLNLNNEELIATFYYAGGCFRYLSYDLDVLKERLVRDISRVKDYKQILSGMQGEASADAINSLMQRFGDATIVVSEYALKLLSAKVGMEFVSMAEKILPRNPSWQGWVFELKFMVKCQKEPSITVYGVVDTSLEYTWNKKGEISVFAYTDIPGSLDDNSWILPEKWNQGCFDAIFYHRKGVIDVIQITKAQDKHDFKFKYLPPFLEKFADGKKCQVNFIVVVSRSNCQSFKLSESHITDVEVVRHYHAEWSMLSNMSIMCDERAFGEASTKKRK